MSNELVSFKGTRNGICIYIKDGNFSLIKNELDRKLKRSNSFFKGGRISDIKGKALTEEEKSEIKELINDKYKLDINENALASENLEEGFLRDESEGMTKFITTTVRSGQTIEYSGNLVILGDINPGGMISAKGNIVVLGHLRGIAHAGVDGNKKVFVAAYELNPTQLRIADIIARKPDGEVNISKWPEIARVCDGEVVIEPYLLKNK
ncbi:MULTISPECIES: septum site-determining protein MinC [Tissierellales]|jgi:septum site-determining protein MinC|uniref:Probable septum site-determining protein MinC n=1 Tax=Acidilutibacter cellobiosedens TaxID=2507161 RepID=A0A410QDV0_9FIRM|nr:MULTISPECIES: septum site-determining protein MinC [Tissierellales]MBE6081259.1 septum site-determining protein MinC [Tissierellaceae bacterium]QAT62212.1 septum site-determining protein MinC [Acidilutibacter cellobiosedens]SCL84122.1 Septum site-determining protein MinC [Sporanaerobacter sp. PP17-6a]